MKISRLHIEKFAVEDYPTIDKENVAAEDLFIRGGNRSGKTLTVNALLYALFGPQATLGIQPGRQSDVQIHFDNDHVLGRGGAGRFYDDGTERVTTGTVDQRVSEIIGEEDIISLQVVHSESDKLPLSRLSGKELIKNIRRLVQSDLQEDLEEYEAERESLEEEIEQVQRTEVKPLQRELDEIDLRQHERKLEKTEQLYSLIESGRIQTIKQRLLDNQELNEELDDLYNRKRTIEQELRKEKRQLREERRYTQDVHDLIIDAIEELTCPVCDQVVPEDTAKRRLKRNRCPQCGRERDLEELKDNLKQKVNTADDVIDSLEQEIDSLKDEKSEVENEIKTIQESVPDLSDLNDLTKHTLKENDYDVDAVTDRTEEELDQVRGEIDQLRTREQDLEAKLEAAEASLSDRTAELEDIEGRISKLRKDSYEEVIVTFQEKWSSHYEEIASELGRGIHIEENGKVLLPGNEGAQEYSELSTGEGRLLNISFAHTVAEFTRDNGDSVGGFEVVIMDEPFANLEEERRESALEFIRESDIQYVITSSNKELEAEFEPHQIQEINTMPVQLTWDDLE